MQDTSAFDAALKDRYGPGIINILPQKVKALRDFEEVDTADWDGRGVTYPIHVTRNEGSGWAAELGALPAAGKQGYATVRIPMKYGYTRIALSAQVIESSQSNKGAFAPALAQETEGAINDIAIERARAIFGDGRGILALVNGDPSTGTTITLDSPGGVAGAVNGSRFIRPGRIITFVIPASGAIRASAAETVVTRPAAGTTVTIGSAAAAAIGDNDYVVAAMNASVTDVSDTSYQKEPMGLLGLIDDGGYVPTLHNVNRTTYPGFASYVQANAGAWSADVIQKCIDIADQKGGGVINKLYMHHSARRAYIASTEDQRRYIGGDLSDPNGGTKAARMGQLSFGPIPVQEDKFCPYGMVFGVDTSGFKRYVQKRGEWIEQGGSILHLIGTGSTLQHAYEGVYTIWDNYHNETPATCFRIDDLTVNVSVVPIN